MIFEDDSSECNFLPVHIWNLTHNDRREEINFAQKTLLQEDQLVKSFACPYEKRCQNRTLQFYRGTAPRLRQTFFHQGHKTASSE